MATAKFFTLHANTKMSGCSFIDIAIKLGHTIYKSLMVKVAIT